MSANVLAEYSEGKKQEVNCIKDININFRTFCTAFICTLTSLQQNMLDCAQGKNSSVEETRKEVEQLLAISLVQLTKAAENFHVSVYTYLQNLIPLPIICWFPSSVEFNSGF